MTVENETLMAKLNEVSDLLAAISAGRLREIIGAGRRFDQVAGCTANCDCKGGYCGCNASVTASERFGTISFPEFLQMREARMRELQAELAQLEKPRSIE
jgi:hypothetical protein